MSQSGASGYMTVNIYSSVGNAPGTLLGTSQLKATATIATDFAWEVFYFEEAISVSAGTGYWIVLDLTSVTGAVYLLTSAVTAVGKYANKSTGVWATQDDIQPLHKIRSSNEAQLVAADTVRFMKDPDAQIRLKTIAGTPHLQRFDEVNVNAELDNVTVKGKYLVERKQNEITVNGYETIFYMRKTG